MNANHADGHDYEVIVGNIGIVYTGPSLIEAKTAFVTYQEQSEKGIGRTAGESVTVMQDGEPMHEYDYVPEEEEEDAETTEPDEDDLVTSDDRNFYQYRKLAFTVGADEDRDDALVRYMNTEQYWPNCWSISDHGNPHLINLDDAYKKTQPVELELSIAQTHGMKPIAFGEIHAWKDPDGQTYRFIDGGMVEVCGSCGFNTDRLLDIGLCAACSSHVQEGN